jgi:hypothetical protein
MKNVKMMTMALTGAVALCCVAAYAGNVVRIVKDEDKTVPKYEETKYRATLKAFSYRASVAGEGFGKPIDGNIGEFLIEDIKLTMKAKKFEDGAIATEELGSVRILFSSSLTGSGFIALLTDEQMKKLDDLVARTPTSPRDNTDPFSFNPPENETGRIFVPKEYPTIQKAVDAGKDGNVIVLSPGVYEETVTISRKSITLVSENPKDEKVVASTIVDAKRKGPAISLDDSSSTIWGITVRGGYTVDKGGGIYIHGKSSALIKGNIIEANSTDKLGGGICIVQAQAPRIVGNIVRNNKAFGAGGIEAIESTVYMKDNKISGNTASSPGGGAWIQECKGVFRENVVSSNSARAGGGLYISQQSTVDILKNELIENASEVGAGVMVIDRCILRIDGNSFVANKAQKAGGAFAFGVESKCKLLNNKFERNEAPKGGVGWVESAMIEEETKNTFKDNKPDNQIVK